LNGNFAVQKEDTSREERTNGNFKLNELHCGCKVSDQTKTGLLIYLVQYSAVDFGPCLTENDTITPYIMSKFGTKRLSRCAIFASFMFLEIYFKKMLIEHINLPLALRPVPHSKKLCAPETPVMEPGG
jgi:hypothetical protein